MKLFSAQATTLPIFFSSLQQVKTRLFFVFCEALRFLQSP
jgi:hypothetical protein